MPFWIVETGKNEYLEYDTSSKTWEVVEGKSEDRISHIFERMGYAGNRVKRGSGKYEGNMTEEKIENLLKTSGLHR